MPGVSVVMPAFNAAGTIRQAIQSILQQTLSDFELIVVDDGSSDETVAVVTAMDDSRLQLVRRPHRGVAETANTATQLARAPILARMDADDVSHPRRLELQYRLLQDQPELDAVGCQVRMIGPSGCEVASLQRYQHWINHETLTPEHIAALRFVELPMVNPTIMAHRRYFDLGFRNHDLPEDYDLMLRAAECGMRFGKVDQVLFDWVDVPSRLTRTDACFSDTAFARCRQEHLLAGPLLDHVSVDLWGFGQTGKPWLMWLQSQAITVRHGYDVNPRKEGVKIHGVTITHPKQLAAADGTPLIIAVGAANARSLILPQMLFQGYRSGQDAWFVA